MKQDLRLEKGRSMVEILGVLAVIGVLSIGGVAGYTYAMQQHKTNKMLKFGEELILGLLLEKEQNESPLDCGSESSTDSSAVDYLCMGHMSEEFCAGKNISYAGGRSWDKKKFGWEIFVSFAQKQLSLTMFFPDKQTCMDVTEGIVTAAKNSNLPIVSVSYPRVRSFDYSTKNDGNRALISQLCNTIIYSPNTRGSSIRFDWPRAVTCVD